MPRKKQPTHETLNIPFEPPVRLMKDNSIEDARGKVLYASNQFRLDHSFLLHQREVGEFIVQAINAYIGAMPDDVDRE